MKSRNGSIEFENFAAKARAIRKLPNAAPGTHMRSPCRRSGLIFDLARCPAGAGKRPFPAREIPILHSATRFRAGTAEPQGNTSKVA
jgi:hypothetical protein